MAGPRYIFAFLLYSICWGNVLADENDQKLLSSDRLKLEQLIEKAAAFAESSSDSCLLYAHEAERLSKAYRSAVHQVKALDILGQYYITKEKYRDALNTYEQLLPIVEADADSLQKGSYYYRLGLSYMFLAGYDDALESFFVAAEHALDDVDNKLLTDSYHEIGKVYSRLGNHTEALNYFQRSLDLSRLDENRSSEASILHSMGQVYFSLNNTQEALAYYLSSLKTYSNVKDSVSIAQVYNSIGKLYENLSDWDRSNDYYTMALDIYAGEMNRSGIADSYYGLGSVQKHTGHHSKALSLISLSLENYKILARINEQALCHQELADIYAFMGDMKSAYEEMKAYQSIFDAVFSENVSKHVAEMEIKYKSFLKDNEIAQLKIEQEEFSRDINRRNISLLIIISLTIMIIMVTIYYTRILRKANVKLQREIEERMNAEKELILIKENLEDRVAERTQALEKAKQKAEESDRLKSAFLANMSHEIRTPLNAITGYSGLLLKDGLEKDKRKKYNDLINKNNRLLLNIIEDLIDTSKLESGTLQLFPKKVNISTMIDQLDVPLSENLIDLNKPNLKIVREKINVKTRTVTTDPVRVQQVMWNLLDNAVKYTAEGTIRYGCYENDGHLIFFVNDTGIGIPDESRELVFEKFRQLDESSKRKYGGTGLGLYYARKISEVLGGKVWFENKNEGGSVFYFSIPVN